MDIKSPNPKAFILINCLTMSRIPLSVLAYMELSTETNRIAHYLLLFLAIVATDFFDGKAARAFHVQSNFGAAADVFCDFFYIITSSYALYRQELFPLWMLALITIKLVEFIITSRTATAGKQHHHIFIFDYIGRYTAISFYVLPVAILIFNRLLSISVFNRVLCALYTTLLFSSMISSVYRIGILSMRKLIAPKSRSYS